jgi:serine/threonine protein phosphatase PrpC
MGNLLAQPMTDKGTHIGKTADFLDYGVSMMQGWRIQMEDAHITEGQLYASDVVVGKSTNEMKDNKIDLPGHSLFAVFDGHTGTFAAFYAGRNFCRVLSRQSKFAQYAQFVTERQSIEETMQNQSDRADYIQSGQECLHEALCSAFIEIDKEIACVLKGERVPDADVPYHEACNRTMSQQDKSYTGNNENQGNGEGSASPTVAVQQVLDEEGDSGTTACVVIITPDRVVCANAGNSRAVISRLGNQALPLSLDHKYDAGGYVAVGLVEGDLTVSRGLGASKLSSSNGSLANSTNDDRNNNNGHQQSTSTTLNTPVPDIRVHTRNPLQDEFVIVASDGIWDVQTNDEAVRTVADMFQEGEGNLGLICEEVCF